MRKSIKRQGRVTLQISALDEGGVQVTVARACNNPAVIQVVDNILSNLARDPNVVIRAVEPTIPLSALVPRRGGPVGMPEAQKIDIVQGWFKVRGRMRAADYAVSRGISAATLRRWIRELLQAGKL